MSDRITLHSIASGIVDAIASVDVAFSRSADDTAIGCRATPTPLTAALIDIPGIPVTVLATRHIVLPIGTVRTLGDSAVSLYESDAIYGRYIVQAWLC